MVRVINEKCVAVGVTDTRDKRRGGWNVAGHGGGGNAYFLMTANGQQLGESGDIHGALEAFEKLPAAERKPKLDGPGEGETRTMKPPKKALVLRHFERFLDRDSRGALRHVPAGELPFPIFAEPQTDHIWLYEEDWRSLVPESPVKGKTYPVPESVAMMILTQYITCHVTGSGAGWAWEDMRPRELTLTVDDVSPSAIHLRLNGHMRSAAIFDVQQAGNYSKKEYGVDVRLLGYLAYDKTKKVFTRFDVIGVGETWGEDNMTMPQYRSGPYGWAMELATGESPLDQIPPSDYRNVRLPE